MAVVVWVEVGLEACEAGWVKARSAGVRMKVRVRISPGARVMLWNPFSSRTGRAMDATQSRTYSCAISRAVCEPVLVMSTFTVIESPKARVSDESRALEYSKVV